VGCSGEAGMCTWEVMVHGAYTFKTMIFRGACSVMA
jgi:hypothetical protein